LYKQFFKFNHSDIAFLISEFAFAFAIIFEARAWLSW